MTRPHRSRLRAALGSVKWYLIERLDKIRMMRAQRMRALQRSAIENLPPLSSSGRSEVDVCMLCGHKLLDMGIAASWSLLRFVPDWRLVVFSDGTLGPDDEKKWRRVIPDLLLVQKEDYTGQVEERFGSFPLSRQMRPKNRHSSKLIDVHLVGNSPYLLLFDSDVLCFRKPTELIEKVRAEKPCIWWNAESSYAYCAPKADLEVGLGYELSDHVNAGVLLTPRFGGAQFAAMERVLQHVGTASGDSNWMSHLWLDQTVYAGMTSLFPGSSMLSADYAVSTRLNKPAVMRHYISVPGIRARYFTEGIRELLRQGAA